MKTASEMLSKQIMILMYQDAGLLKHANPHQHCPSDESIEGGRDDMTEESNQPPEHPANHDKKKKSELSRQQPELLLGSGDGQIRPLT